MKILLTGSDALSIRLAASAICTKLVSLKHFAYEVPGLGYPKWKLYAVNRLQDRQKDAILASS